MKLDADVQFLTFLSMARRSYFQATTLDLCSCTTGTHGGPDCFGVWVLLRVSSSASGSGTENSQTHTPPVLCTVRYTGTYCTVIVQYSTVQYSAVQYKVQK